MSAPVPVTNITAPLPLRVSSPTSQPISTSPKLSPPTQSTKSPMDKSNKASRAIPQAVNGPPSGMPPMPPAGPTAGGPMVDSFGRNQFDLYSSNTNLGSLSNLPSFGSMPSLPSLPNLLDKDTKPSTEPTHRDATVTATGAPTGTDNGRLVPPSPSTPNATGSSGGGGGTPPSGSSRGGSRRAAARGQPLPPLQPHPGAQQNVPQQPSPQPQQVQSPPTASPSPNNALVSTQSPENRRIINPVTVPNGQNFVDITEYLNMPQSEAAKKLSIPPSTLSKRWKEAVRNRKWPWRVVCKLDKEIMTLLHNVPQGAPIPEEIEGRLGYLMRKRQEELKPVVIRL